MSYLSDAHSEWHIVNGKYNPLCPLDCGALDPKHAEMEDLSMTIDYYDTEGTASISCGHCQRTHYSVLSVRACADLNRLFAPV